MKTQEQRIEDMRSTSREDLLSKMKACGTKTAFRYEMLRSWRVPSSFNEVLAEKNLTLEFSLLGAPPKRYKEGGAPKICKLCGESEEKAYFATGRAVCRPCQHKNWEMNRISEGRDPWKIRRKNKHRLLAREGLKVRAGFNYEQAFEEAGGLCLLCREPEKRTTKFGVVKRLAVDHCHKSKKIRGLLCGDCNTALGLFKDSIATLERALEYLKKHSS